MADRAARFGAGLADGACALYRVVCLSGHHFGVGVQYGVDQAREAGYMTGACLDHSLVPLGPHLWPRVGIWHHDSDLRFRLKISRFTRNARASRLGPTLSRVHGWRTRPAPQT